MTGFPTQIGRYRIQRLLGRGAMGAVYVAEDPELGREVALKVILEEAHQQPEEREEAYQRFLREARIGARLLHPNIVTVLDAGRDRDQLFLVMEYVRGESLHARMSRGDYPSPELALDWLAQAADGLAYAHRMGVIHRDIKPANLLITPEGLVKIADFGVAKALTETTELTRTGMLVGSPAYMSPEQIRGEPLDGRSDLFSLGVILYELLLQRRPFPAETVTALVYQILHEDPLAEPSLGARLSPPLGDLLRWMLAKKKEERSPEAGLVAERLRELSRSFKAPATSAAASSVPVVGAAEVPSQRSTVSGSLKGKLLRPRSLAVGGALLVSLGLLVFLFSLSGRPPKAPEVGKTLLPVEEPPEVLPQPVVPKTDRPLSAAESTVSVPSGPETPAPVPGPPKPEAAVAVPSPQPSQPEPVGLGWPPAEAAKPEPRETSVSPTTGVQRDASPGVVSRDQEMPPQGDRPSPTPPSLPPPAVAQVYVTSKAVKFDIDPEEAFLEIDGKVIGTADEWDGMGGAPVYEFDREGSHFVKVSLPGYETVWLRIDVRADAKQAVVSVDYELKKARSR